MRNLEGDIYTVDEVSDLLGIPRPTLYRYLREYSIPHLRKAGRISIPEDSFDRIREARDLHREGLGTETVRRQLREGSAPDKGELDRRLDTLHETLESLRGDIKERPATDEVSLSPTLRTILARQSLLMSAMFNLTEMVEDLLLASGKRRKPLFEDLKFGVQEPLPERPARDQLEISGTVPATANAISGAVHRPPAPRPASFGTLGRRRRRGVLAIVVALLLAVCLALAMPELIGNSEPSVPRVTEAANEPPGEPKAVAAADQTTDQTTARESSRQSNVAVAAGGSEPDEGKVPDVSGRSLEAAAGIISGAGFEISAIKTEPSQEDPETIIGTEPSAGASARAGAPVILTMSGGPTGIPPGFQTTSAGASISASATASASASAGTSVSASAGYTN